MKNIAFIIHVHVIYQIISFKYQTLPLKDKWDHQEDTDLLESFSKYSNLELEFVKNNVLILMEKKSLKY